MNHSISGQVSRCNCRNWGLALALLSGIGLPAADYTVEEVARRLDALQPIRLEVPAEISQELKVPVSEVSTCPRCGGRMRMKADQRLMAELFRRLQPTLGWLELDASRICPHCGDGKYYLRTRRRAPQAASPGDGTPATELESRAADSVPVTEEDLLLLHHALFPVSDGGAQGGRPPSRAFWFPSLRELPGASAFVVQSDGMYRKLCRETEWRLRSAAPSPGVDKEKILAQQAARQRALKQSAAIFQRLTENGTVLRRQDLDDLLKQTAELRKSSPGFAFKGSSYMMLTRMMIGKDNLGSWTPLSCPKCHAVFHVLNGTNSPHMAPLGDLLTLLECFDLRPDYSTICPHCHPETTPPRRLRVTFRLGDQEYASALSPYDIALLAVAFQPTVPPEACQGILTPGQLLRLRSILQGLEDASGTSAAALP